MLAETAFLPSSPGIMEMFLKRRHCVTRWTDWWALTINESTSYCATTSLSTCGITVSVYELFIVVCNKTKIVTHSVYWSEILLT